MAIVVFSRYEKKYLIDDSTYRYIIDSISDHMVPDKYSKNGEFYNIANIYYDTLDDALIRASIEKPVYKEKLRLRSYGVPELDDKVFLEIKKKYKGLVNKRRTKLKLCEAYDLTMDGIYPEIQDYMNPQVLSEIEYFLKCTSYNLRYILHTIVVPILRQTILILELHLIQILNHEEQM